ncbi:hypothetical protein D9613_008663 [Agrocybe pediades]|uniref:Uncharacterized protein n=1 Tax=Agrocybe pediades TaxID=84607 RepID=A0A8H4QTS6_9AGAR|nr:hypothetical protein D9613_008663 [Agrocybe pediades]
MPGPNESKLKKALRRIDLMLLTIITPEFIVFWAMRQWYGARKMVRDFEEIRKRDDPFKWTKTHGFFLQMGDFMLYKDGEPLGILGWKPLLQHYADGRITSRLSTKYLTLTELELATAALATLSLFMYILWWNKPFNAEVPIAVTLSGPDPDSISENPGGIGEIDNHEVLNFRLREMKFDASAFGRDPQSLITKTLKTHLDSLSRLAQTASANGDSSFYKINALDLDYERMPTMRIAIFYSINLEPSRLGLLVLGFLQLAILFGAIHCIGWCNKINFPSNSASTLWRIASATIAACPAFWFFAIVTALARSPGKVEQSATRDFSIRTIIAFLYPAINYMYVLSIPLYIIARAALFVMAFVGLRKAPSSALINIPWSNVLPFNYHSYTSMTS